MNYGMPYKGSKNRIAKFVIDRLPDGDVFVDLFGGGGAITHAAVLSGKYKRIIYNDIDPIVSKAFKMAINGEFGDEHRWIDREDFFQLKDTDFYVAACFSFGNNLIGYCYAKEIEPWKKALHYARVFNDFSELEKFGIKSDGSRADITAHKEEYKKKYICWYMKNVLKLEKEYQFEKSQLEMNIKDESERLRNYLINARNTAGITVAAVDRHLGTNSMSGHYFGRSQWQFPTREAYQKMQEIMPTLDKDYDDVVGLSILWQSLESLESLQSLESFERLKRLEMSGNIEIFNTDYQNIEIPHDSVIYCDIPYRNTDGYRFDFDYERFYGWAKRQDNIYISEYNMPDDFRVVDSIEKTVNLSAVTTTKSIEKLFTPKRTEVL